LENADTLDDGDLSSELSVITTALDEPIPQDAPIYHLQLSYSHETFFALYRGEEALSVGSSVIVPTRYGRDLAEVTGVVQGARSSAVLRITRIERRATREDMEKARRNRENEESAFDICKEKIERHDLRMKLVRVHYLLEEGKILFFFTADNRVDFRELVKDLVAVFKTRIELRQIGIRDESRILGGCGICGRLYCCHAISDKLKPVSIKMAKDQNLSLNSMKISGSCGRLLCCLSYEHAYYAEQRRLYPPEGSRLSWDETTWRVREINVILGLVTLDSEDGRQLMLPRARFDRADGSHWRISDIE
jgi:cell fate regulator YaaT (PSP1 superfamily)